MGAIDVGSSAKALGGYLERYGWSKYQVVEDSPVKAAVMTGWSDALGGNAHVMTVALERAKSVLQFTVPGIGFAPRDKISAGHLADVLMAVTFSNFASYIGSFSYDPGDGEVRLEYSLPLDNSSLSYEQFARVVGTLTATTDYWAQRIAGICQGQRTGESVVVSFVGHLRDFQGGAGV
jgi:hypothetical protein